MIVFCAWIALSIVWITNRLLPLARYTSLRIVRSAAVLCVTSIVDLPDNSITPSLPDTIELATWCDMDIASFINSSTLWLFFSFRCRRTSFLLSGVIKVASVAPVVAAFAACEEAVAWECAMAAI